jgi:DNA-binding response OmpR family regulator
MPRLAAASALCGPRDRSLPPVPACTTEPNTPVAILSVSAVRDDHTALRQLVSGMACQIATAGTCHKALRSLSRRRVAVVVCERELPDGTWRDILSYTVKSPERPFLIVTSRVADENLWAEVLNLGGFDVIAKPFSPREVRHVLETACLRRRVEVNPRMFAAVG